VSVTAFVLVAVAAAMHASWNLLSKQAAQAGTIAFVWLMFALSTVIYAPVLAVYMAITHPHLRALAGVFLVGTALLHVGYGLLLQRGYSAGDLSLVYPLARGSGLLLSSFAAIPLYAEHPGPAGIAGILLIAGGVTALSLPEEGGVPKRAALAFGLLTGLFIAGYTLWDKYAVATLRIPPLLEEVAAGAGVTLLLAPLAVRNARMLAPLWRGYRMQVLGAAILSPLAYLLVLTALVFSPVSSIAPAREISVLAGVLLGRRLLGEGSVGRRLAAAAAIAAGVTAIVVG
jgi:drug/metabolite transporter (DMT)-like permease